MRDRLISGIKQGAEGQERGRDFRSCHVSTHRKADSPECFHAKVLHFILRQPCLACYGVEAKLASLPGFSLGDAFDKSHEADLLTEEGHGRAQKGM